MFMVGSLENMGMQVVLYLVEITPFLKQRQKMSSRDLPRLTIAGFFFFEGELRQQKREAALNCNNIMDYS